MKSLITRSYERRESIATNSRLLFEVNAKWANKVTRKIHVLHFFEWVERKTNVRHFLGECKGLVSLASFLLTLERSKLISRLSSAVWWYFYYWKHVQLRDEKSGQDYRSRRKSLASKNSLVRRERAERQDNFFGFGVCAFAWRWNTTRSTYTAIDVRVQ